MNQGMMPYRDLFDHKGPLLHAINWLGMLVGFSGVWLIELVSLSLAAFFCYKTARRFYGELASFLGTFAAFTALLSWFNGGNLTETYSLPFLFGALYCLTGYFAQGYELGRKQVFLSGLCMGGALMLKGNLIGLWLGLCAVIFFHSVAIKKYKLLPRYVLLFVAGILSFLAPFMLWLGLCGALDDFLRCYIQANFLYIDTPFKEVINSINSALAYPIVPLALALVLLSLFKKSEGKANDFVLNLSLLSMSVVALLTSSMSGYIYSHYYIVFTPCIVLPVAGASEAAISHFRTKSVIVFLAICIVLNQSIIYGAESLKHTMKTDMTILTLAKFVQANTLPDEPFQDICIGIGGTVNLLSERFSAGYYPYYAQWFPPSMTDKYVEEMKKTKPRMIGYGGYGKTPDTIMEVIDNNYTIVYEEGVVKIGILNE
jgi:hypothetical protein